MIGSREGYALVTGASSGIGHELAKLFAKDGKNIVAVARSKDKLEELKGNLEKEHGTKVRVLVKDLSDPKAPQEIFSELQKEGINVDVLVNNAGFAVYGKFSDSDWQKEAEMIQVNIIALTALTKLFLKKMLERKSGKILNISSGVGLMPAPWVAVYSGTKHYVLGFSNAIARELKGTGIGVTCFCPSVTKTLFYKRANAENTKALKQRGIVMEADAAAKHAYRALQKGKTTAAAGLLMSIMVSATIRLMPRDLACSLSYSFLAPK